MTTTLASWQCTILFKCMFKCICIQLRAKVHRFILQKQTIQITNMPFERKKDHAKMFTKFNVSKYSLVKKIGIKI